MVLIYGRPGCGYCIKAKLLAQSHGINFEYKDITEDDSIREELYRAYPDTKTVPQIWVNNKHVGGYNEFATELENTGVGNFGEGGF